MSPTPIAHTAPGATASFGRRRTLSQTLMDSVAARMFKLPKPTHRYTTIRDVEIPMRDGVRLLADVLLPTGRSKGTLLSRTPYGWAALTTALLAAPFARQGYTVVLARCRGTFGSGGVFRPFADERNDGADTVTWLRNQPWFTGTFATFGASYAAYTQWAILAESPPELATAVITTTCHDFRRGIYRGGAFSHDTWFDWSERMTRQEEVGPWRVMAEDRKAAKAAPALKRGLPLAPAAEQAFKGKARWHEGWLLTRDLSDPMWEGLDSSEALEKVDVPILVEVGWQDIFLDQGIEEVMALQGRGVAVAMTAGPWTHRGTFLEGGAIVTNEALEWFDEHLANLPAKRSAPVRAFVNGRDEWVDLASWPPPAEEISFYPTGAGELERRPAATGSTRRFTYDPTDPTPTIGGPVMSPGGGYADDTALAIRSDVLSFTSAPIAEGFRVLGAPKVALWHSTDNPNVDVFVRLSLVDTSGHSRNVSEGFIRLDASSSNGQVIIELDPTGQDFEVGDRIRLVVAGGSFPRWERNLGTGENPATSEQMAPSTRTIALDQSRLTLPVLSGAARP